MSRELRALRGAHFVRRNREGRDEEDVDAIKSFEPASVCCSA